MDTKIIRFLRKTYTITLTALLLTGFAGANTASAAYREDAAVSDMALIYQGGTHRPEWTEDELRPYVAHTFADGHTEMEFDSNVLYEKEDSYFSRLESYINAFEAHGVFEQSSIAYYSGTKGILDMYRSPSIENTLILDRIAHHISDRRSRGVGMEATNRQQTEITVTGGIGEIFISGNPESIRIHTPNGVLVSQNVRRWQCPPGLYIVAVDREVKKVMVR